MLHLLEVNISRSWRLSCCIALLCLAGLDAHALSATDVVTAESGTETKAASAQKTDLVSDPVLLLNELRQKLAETQAEIGNDADQTPQAAGQPVVNADAFPRKLFAHMIVHAIELQIQSVEELKAQRQRFLDWQRNAQNQVSAVQPGLSPFLESDQLRDTLLKNDKQVARLEQILRLVAQDVGRRIQATEQSAIKLRQIDEDLNLSKGIEKAQLSEKRAELTLRHRFNWIRMISEQVEIQHIKQELKEVQSKREVAEVRLAKIGGSVNMTDNDLEHVRRGIRADRQALLSGIQSDMAHLNTLSGTGQGKVKIEATVTQATEWHLQGLESLLHFLQLRQMIWESRRAFVSVRDKDTLRQIYEQIQYWVQDAQVFREYLELRLWQTLQLASENGIGAQTGMTPTDLQATVMEQVNMYSRMIGALESNESLLLRYKQDFEAHVQIKTEAERWHERWLTVRKVLSDIWNYELFVADDAIEVDGQLIKGQRSITVDKVISALLILILGCWLALILARFIENLAVSRLSVDPYLARIGRRWFLFIEIAAVVVASLLVVHIPLTVFAFMGGAVAIGAGFGMQNLLKNLISGLMLLLEKPFRPGDFVEVGNVRGRIVDIGIRSSLIRDGNGIETLVPNNVFIEERVTNWTLSSQSIRIVIKVAVVYDSPLQLVTDILLEAAERHGMVQDKPAPQVLFEDFGNEGLVFGLYVWLELSPQVDWRLVASDLRYIINKRFLAEGIAVAFTYDRKTYLPLGNAL